MDLQRTHRLFLRYHSVIFWLHVRLQILLEIIQRHLHIAQSNAVRIQVILHVRNGGLLIKQANHTLIIFNRNHRQERRTPVFAPKYQVCGRFDMIFPPAHHAISRMLQIAPDDFQLSRLSILAKTDMITCIRQLQ